MFHIIQPYLSRFPVSLSQTHPRLTRRSLKTSLTTQTAQRHGVWGIVGSWWCHRQRIHSSQRPWPQKLQTKPRTHTESDTGEESTRGAKHSPLVGGSILTVSPCNEHHNVGIVEGVAHLQGGSKPVWGIPTLPRKGSWVVKSLWLLPCLG